jgi:hypothetical protein
MYRCSVFHVDRLYNAEASTVREAVIAAHLRVLNEVALCDATPQDDFSNLGVTTQTDEMVSRAGITGLPEHTDSVMIVVDSETPIGVVVPIK